LAAELWNLVNPAHNAAYHQRVLETNLTKAGIALPKWEWQNMIIKYDHIGGENRIDLWEWQNMIIFKV
jgi:hypothetical protein